VGVTADGAVRAEAAETTRRSHVASLGALVGRVLDAARVRIEDVDGIAVSIGPGSFTGRRIVLGFAKGIALAGGTALVGVPTLEALAHVAGAAPGETVCAALDARKQEVYAALFAARADGALERRGPDEALPPAALAARLPPACLLVGDAGEAYADAFRGRARVLPFATHHPRGGIVARLGAARLLAGERANAGELEPAYVRPPEARLPAPASR
jgi:tRNA threonylcarbamoyladenosine biosynthesis protein TsaB